MAVAAKKAAHKRVLTAENKADTTVAGLVDKALKSVTGYRDAVQAAAVAIIQHAEIYGDCRRAKVLARGVPARERNMLIGYFALYSPIGVQIGKTANDDKCRFIQSESKRYHNFNLDGAKANKWSDDPAKASPEPKPLNTLADAYGMIEGLLKRLIAQAEADDEKNKFEPNDRPVVLSQMKELRATVSKFRSTHLKPVPANSNTEKAAA